MNQSKNDPEILPDNISPVRYMMDKALSLNTEFLNSFEKAKITSDAVMIMEGDWGGQIYLVCQMDYIKCGLDTLVLLLKDLDDIAWKCNEGEGNGIYYEVRKCGEGIGGGMGGGLVKPGLWVHNEFIEKKLENEIKKVLLGEKKRIDTQNIQTI